MISMRKEDVKTEKDVREFLKDGPEFARSVYLVTYKIPQGKVCTYGRVAKLIGKPGASRAVANALHNNPLYPVVPCWRVVKEDGGFGGDAKAAAGRRARVQSEGVRTRNGKVVMSDDVLY